MLVLPEILDPGYRQVNTVAIARLLVEIGLGIGIAEKALEGVPIGPPVPCEMEIELGVREAVALYPRKACYVVVPRVRDDPNFRVFREWEEGIYSVEMRQMAIAMATFVESLGDVRDSLTVDRALTVDRVRQAFEWRLEGTSWNDADLRLSSTYVDRSLVLMHPDGTPFPVHVQELCRSYRIIVALRPRPL